MIEELAWIGAGMAAGTAAGLVPGIHANTVAFMALYFPFEKGMGFALFIVSMTITNSFVDAVPAVLLGAPSEENVNAMLPGHEMLLKGKGLEAIMLVVFGALASAIIALALMPLFFSFATRYESSFPVIVPVLVAVSFAAMVWSEEKKMHALLLGLACGALGIVALEKIDNAIFVLITGFFGVTGLFESILSGSNLPQQSEEISGNAPLFPALLSSVASGFTALFPGIGPTQATVMLKGISRIGRRGYLVITGGMGVGNLVFSLLMLFAINKGRSGMAVALQNFVPPDFSALLLLLAGAAIAAGFSAPLTEWIARKAIRKIRAINYRILSAIVLAALLFLVALSSGALGMLACACASGLAFFGVGNGLRRSQCMAFLLVPTVFFYLGLGI